jgi:hypothetical protein
MLMSGYGNFNTSASLFYAQMNHNTNTLPLAQYWGLASQAPTHAPSTPAPTTPPTCAFPPGTRQPNPVSNIINTDVFFKSPVTPLALRTAITTPINYTQVPFGKVYKLDTRCATGPSAVYIATNTGTNGELLVVTDFNYTSWAPGPNDAFRSTFIFNHATPEPNRYYVSSQNNRLYQTTGKGLLQFTLVSAVANPNDLIGGGSGGHAKIENIPAGLIVYLMMTGYGNFQASATTFYNTLIQTNETQELYDYWFSPTPTTKVSGASTFSGSAALLLSLVLLAQ